MLSVGEYSLPKFIVQMRKFGGIVLVVIFLCLLVHKFGEVNAFVNSAIELEALKTVQF